MQSKKENGILRLCFLVGIGCLIVAVGFSSKNSGVSNVHYGMDSPGKKYQYEAVRRNEENALQRSYDSMFMVLNYVGKSTTVDTKDELQRIFIRQVVFQNSNSKRDSVLIKK